MRGDVEKKNDNNTIAFSFKQHSRCGATYEGHPVSHRSGFIRFYVCLVEYIVCLHARLSPKYPSFTRDPSSNSIMIRHVIEQLLQKGITWITKKYIWRQVRKISATMVCQIVKVCSIKRNVCSLGILTDIIYCSIYTNLFHANELLKVFNWTKTSPNTLIRIRDVFLKLFYNNRIFIITINVIYGR